MNLLHVLFAFVLLSFTSCIGDDFVDDFIEPEIRISTVPESIAACKNYKLDIDFFNDVGQASLTELTYLSSDENIFTIDLDGVISAISKGIGNLTVTTEYNGTTYSNTSEITVTSVTIISEPETKSGTIRTTSSYQLKGTFTIESIDNGIQVKVNEDYIASEALPELYIYLTNNPNTNNGALEIGKVDIFEGAHTYTIDGVTNEDFSHLLYYCKPFGVKVRDGPIE